MPDTFEQDRRGDRRLAPRMRIGIDLGGTKIEAVVLDAGRRDRVSRSARPTPRGDYDAHGARRSRRSSREAEHAIGRACTVGIGMPGAISPATGLVKNANSTWLNGRPLHHDLEARLGRGRCVWPTTPTASRCRRRATAPPPAPPWCSA